VTQTPNAEVAGWVGPALTSASDTASDAGNEDEGGPNLLSPAAAAFAPAVNMLGLDLGGSSPPLSEMEEYEIDVNMAPLLVSRRFLAPVELPDVEDIVYLPTSDTIEEDDADETLSVISSADTAGPVTPPSEEVDAPNIRVLSSASQDQELINSDDEEDLDMREAWARELASRVQQWMKSVTDFVRPFGSPVDD